MKIFIITIIINLTTIHVFANGLIINVKEYGAKGNGVNDDTKYIQTAINSASPLSETTIYFPAGVYRIASYIKTHNYLENYCLLIHSNINFIGDSDKTIIRLANHMFDKEDKNANAHIFYGKRVENVTFSDLVIDMNGVNNLVPKKGIKNHSAIFTSYGSNYYIHNITIKNCSGTNMINIMSKGVGLIIEDCKFLNGGNYVGTDMPNSNQYDFSFIYTEWDSTFIRNNIIEQQDIDIALKNYSGGVELHGSFSSVVDNSIKGCWPAIYITSSNGGDSMRNIIVADNKLLNCIVGISFWLIEPMTHISLLDNEIHLSPSKLPKQKLCTGILIPNGNMEEYNGNLANAAPINDLEISRNIISADSMQSLSSGMILHSLQNSNVLDNIISEMNYGGIVLAGSKWGTRSLNVSNNVFEDFRENNDKNAVAAYIIVTDTYSQKINAAPGFKEILFSDNKFLHSKRTNKISAKGQFRGVFVAVPSRMIGDIKFMNNKFTDSAEKIQIIKTD